MTSCWKRFAAVAVVLIALGAMAFAGDQPPFGAASAYNLTALGTVDSQGNTLLPGTISTQADIGGRIAAAFQVISGTTIGSSIGDDPWGSYAPYDMISPNGLSAGANFNVNSSGNAYAPGTNGTINFNGGGHRVTSGGSGVDFTALRQTLDTYTMFISGLTQNGSVGGVDPWNPQNLLLHGTSSTLNVFNLTAAQFNGTSSLDIIVPIGSTVVVNVSGTSLDLQRALLNNGQQISGDDQSNNKFLFNFSQATSVQINAQFSASILSPFAVLSGGSQMDGTFIAAQVGDTGEVHNIEFQGILPDGTTPEPGTLLTLGTGVLGMAVILRRKRRA